MASFLLAMLAVLIAGLGARDQVLVADLAERQGPRPAILLLAVLTAGLSAAAAGWAGAITAPLLIPRARTMLVAMVLGLAALELLFVRPRGIAKEPTNSLGAFAVVLLVQQLTDAARLLIFALAAASAVPQLAALGGAVGGGLSVLGGWLAAQHLRNLPLVAIRRGLGLGSVGLALWLAL